MKKNDIIEPLFSLYDEHRKVYENVSDFTKSAQKITKDWQNFFKNELGIEVEVPIVKNSKSKIDLIDCRSKPIIAYELKVSGNNPHHEFYKDVFKVMAFNKYCEESMRIDKLIFVTESNGEKRLKSSDLGKEILKSGNFDFSIEIETYK
jgi:hypothetical protein